MKVQYHDQHKVHIKTAFLIRRLLIAWLAGAAVELLLLPVELRDLANLDGIARMSAGRMLAVAAVVFALLLLMGRFLPERWLIFGAACVLLGASLASSFTWPFLIAAVLVMTVLLIMTPTVFFAIQRVFDWGDKVFARLRRKPKKIKKGKQTDS